MSLNTSVVESFAAALVACRTAPMPEHVLEKAQLCLADYFSAAYEARNLPWAQQAIGHAEKNASGAASIPLGAFSAAGDAAFANAVAAHGLVREDMHVGSIAHLGIVVWPALLAELSRTGRQVTGHELLAAAVAGYEAGARLGSAIMTAELARLFRPTGIVGPFAAVAALCQLRTLDANSTSSALSLAVNCAAGLNQWPVAGGSDMYFHAGFAARNALTCVDLAASGAFATRDVVEGEAGIFRAFARREPQPVKGLFQDGFEILKVFHKQAPACNFAQTPSQAALAARLKLEVDSAQVAAIRVDATQAALLYPGCNAVGPFDTMLAAKMSIQFGVASVVRRARLDSDNYADLEDAEIARLISRTRLVADPELTAAYPGRQPARVTLTTFDGQEISCALDDVEVASSDLVYARFLSSARAALGASQAAELVDHVNNLATGDASPLNALQVPRNVH
ncbi:MmgE/PrpD family protein [Devosia faecipullorum]|uniref:MmgE/PrpD family protein n=1 Tax=Devosia faecipullorum TaxID=2755039 RepID=UPI00187B1CD5|nr:MmgE/PrpD family protein [Devosia faecipullorum]MBE7734262.1 MmgE/PrpD family protein [Devosia faecipullorum]